MIKITSPLAEEVYNAYCELIGALDVGINQDHYADLKEKFNQLQKRVNDSIKEQDDHQHYVELARAYHHAEGELEIDEDAIISLSDEGAYVESWLWLDEPEQHIQLDTAH